MRDDPASGGAAIRTVRARAHATTTGTMLTDGLRQSAGHGQAVVHAARALHSTFTPTREALAEGKVSSAHATAATRAAREFSSDVLEEAEPVQLEVANEGRQGMTANVGRMDRGIRAAVAVVLLGLAVATHSWPLLVLSAAVALTALMSFCPLYRLYGLSTVDGLRRDCGPGGCATPGRPHNRQPPSSG